MSETNGNEEFLRKWVSDFNNELDIDLIKIIYKLKDNDLSDTLLSLWVALETDNTIEMREDNKLKKIDRDMLFHAYRNMIWLNSITLKKDILNDDLSRINIIGSI